MGGITIDSEFQSLIPTLTDDEYQRLEKSILAEGVRECIITWDGVIIDGHNRYRICQEHGLECPSIQRKFDSRDAAKIWIIENQFARRNLNGYQRSVLGLQLEPLYAAEAKRRQIDSGRTYGRGQEKVCQKSDEPIRTDERIAEVAGVSRDTIRKVKAIEQEADKGNPIAIKARDELTSGERKSIHGAYISVVGKEKPRKQQDTITDDGRKICVMCGEPINEGEAYAFRPTIHKKCENEYQCDFEKQNRAKYRDAERDLRENVAIYTIESLMNELAASAKNMRQAWDVSIEINESMGVRLTATDKKQLGNAAQNLFNTIERIRGKHENV